jgi:predicted RNase H-like HicB family nuclease
MMLILEEADEGGFVVKSPIDPGLVTQAETLQEAFLMAYDAAEGLAMGRKRLSEHLVLSQISTTTLRAGPEGAVDPTESPTPERYSGSSIPPSSRPARSGKKRGRA